MKNILKESIIVLTLVFFLAVLGFMAWSVQGSNGSNNQMPIAQSANVSVTPIINQDDDSLILPPNDQISSNINWSKYPILSYSGILLSTIGGPNSIINHSFVDIHIRVEIKNPEDIPEVYKEMSSIVKAEKAIIGPDSSVEIYGFTTDGYNFHVGMLPYSSEIYRRDYVHPVHNLTFSDIDVSEVD